MIARACGKNEVHDLEADDMRVAARLSVDPARGHA